MKPNAQNPEPKAHVKPYGTWPSPITAASVAAQGVRLSNVALDAGNVYWLEGRPLESGRHVLVRHTAAGVTHDVTPPAFNVRTRVHEYGGGAYAVRGGLVCFSNFADQRLYAIDGAGETAPRALTPEGRWFYADGVIDDARRLFVCVREDHTRDRQEPINALVAVSLDAANGASESPGRIIASGYDFYASPRLSPDGTMLCWICWNHPQMPWDGTELWIADVAADGSLERSRRIAGGASESIYQPGWSQAGQLLFVSDRDGWWQLYGLESVRQPEARTRPIVLNPPAAAEFGRAQWALGTQSWTCAGARQLFVSYGQGGRQRLGAVDLESGRLDAFDAGLDPLEWLAADANHLVFIGASPRTLPSVVRVHLGSNIKETLRATATGEIAEGYLAQPEPIVFEGSGGLPVHAFYYPPANADVSAPDAERPPLIVISHGGPTTATSVALDLRVQYWTSRGFAVVDVNYGGSTGYGRAYRERLRGRWGIVDVDDVVAAARVLASSGRADSRRLIVRGGSAGGFTTLAALTAQPDVFSAGASYYGVSDLEGLARETHKFESRYLDSLVGPYPAMRDTYRQRSPIDSVDRLACALIFFQGLEDRVVPPEQSAMMADAVRRKGLPVAYLTFEGEQHGFRRAETIARCLDAELFFYGALFGFTPADLIDPIAIDNLPVSSG